MLAVIAYQPNVKDTVLLSGLIGSSIIVSIISSWYNPNTCVLYMQSILKTSEWNLSFNITQKKVILIEQACDEGYVFHKINSV